MSNTKKVGSILRTRCWAGMRGIRSLFRLSRPNVDDDEKGFSAFSLLLAAKRAFMFQIRTKKPTDNIEEHDQLYRKILK